jgi:uroporphyrinogen-III decarboxylase
MAMTRRERLMATLQGRPVDRPAVSFYEIGGFAIDPADPDPFNIYNDPSWRPLLELAEAQTDLIRLRTPRLTGPAERVFVTVTTEDTASRWTRTTVRAGGRTLTSLTRRDRAVNTVWVVEHLLKDVADLKAYLEIPDEALAETVDVADLWREDRELGDRGVIMVDTPDPLCLAAALFSMEDYVVIAFTEPVLFHRLLEKFARVLHRRTEIVAREFPGRLWRIYGPEYASEPFLPTRLFEEYVVRYTGPMVDLIQRHGGYARIHCHGRIRHLLPHFVKMGAVATDPIEPPPQGDITLAEVRRDYGRDLVLFGNLEIADIENLAPAQFEQVVAQTLRDGTAGEGRGFVLLPSAAPYGRSITPTTLANYETMVRLVQGGPGTG